VATSLSNELAQFHRFVADKLAKGEASLSPEAAVDQWREMHPASDDLAEDVAAVKEALADMAAGDVGISLDTFDQEFRAKYGLPPRP
jgi:hypothetical protein